MLGGPYENQIFEKQESINKGEYDNCTFKNCALSAQDLSNFSFIECTFEQCDLSSVQVRNTSFKGASFLHCKLLGVNFSEVNAFLLDFSFSYCMLSYSSFYQLKLPKMAWKNCMLEEADFSEAELTSTQFIDCDLRGAMFDQTNLEKSNLSTSINYTIDPENNRIRKAKFSRDGAMGLLAKYDILIS